MGMTAKVNGLQQLPSVLLRILLGSSNACKTNKEVVQDQVED